MGSDATVQFQIQYHGTKGDENFDLYLFGQKFTFRNIGTSQQNLVRRITGPIGDLKIVFHNAGTGSDKKCWNEDHRRCRRRRRWGRRRTSCSGNSRVNKCSGGAWQRNVIIKKLTLNGSDIKDFFERSVTSCDPRSGNITKKFKVNGGVLDTTGNYLISKADINANAIGEFVGKPIYDQAVDELETSVQASKSTASKLSGLQVKHGSLTSDYNDLLSKMGLAGDALKKGQKQLSNVNSKFASSMANAASSEEQVKILQAAVSANENQTAATDVELQEMVKNRYQDIEKENTNLDKENKDRSHTNDTFKKKTYYQLENAAKFDDYNNIMIYIYLFLVFSVICMFLFKDSNDWEKFKKNIWYSLGFFIIIILYPFYIYDFELKILSFINYIYSMFSSRVYNGQSL